MTDAVTSDLDLLERWRAGDAASGELLFERHYDGVERFFLNKIRDAVSDLVQETFARCVASRERIREHEQFRLYLFGIAYRVLTTHLRMRYRGGTELVVDEASIVDLAAGPSTQLAARGERRSLLDALRRIPIDDQVVIELHYWEGLTTDELAEALAIPAGTARGRLQRARARLADIMHERTSSPDDLASTTAQLEDWAKECRAQLGRERGIE